MEVWIALDHVFYFFETHLVVCTWCIFLQLLLNLSWACQVADHPVWEPSLLGYGDRILRWRRIHCISVKGSYTFLKLLLWKSLSWLVISSGFWPWCLLQHFDCRVRRHQTGASPCESRQLRCALMNSLWSLHEILTLWIYSFEDSLCRTQLILSRHHGRLRGPLKLIEFVKQLWNVPILRNLKGM